MIKNDVAVAAAIRAMNMATNWSSSMTLTHIAVALAVVLVTIILRPVILSPIILSPIILSPIILSP